MLSFDIMDAQERAMRFEGLDLNLLVAFDALMEARSVTAASRRLNLSQSAMSAAIGRLRTFFDDDLFIMAGRPAVAAPAAPLRGGKGRGEVLTAAPHEDSLLRPALAKKTEKKNTTMQ